MATVRRTLGLGVQTAALAVLTLVAAAVAGLALNWLVLLFGFGSIRQASGGVGPVSYGVLVLVLGILLPIGWLLAAQPYVMRTVARWIYRPHKDEVLARLVGALERELGERAPTASAEQLAEVVRKIRESAGDYPGPVRPLIRLGLRRAKLEEVESALREGIGPASARLGRVIGERIEAELSGGRRAGFNWSRRSTWR